VLACYLYRHLCNAPAHSAGLDPGERTSDRAEDLLRAWGIDVSAHTPSKLSSSLCTTADAIFVMAPSYLHRMFVRRSLQRARVFRERGVQSQRSLVRRPTDVRTPAGPGVDARARPEIRRALLGEGRRLIPASEYLDLCRTVDLHSH
jgi:protein-tyrosine-phosphatase